MKKKNLFADILGSVTKYFLILVVLVLIGICCSGIRVVESGNVALILRCGKLVGDTPEEQIHEPGLLLAFPYIIDEVVIVPTGSVFEQSVTTHYTDDSVANTADGGYVLTGDQNVAVLSASVKYTISDPVSYALYVGDVQSVINGCVSSALLGEAARYDVDDLLTNGKDAFAAKALEQARKKLDQVGVGITLTTLELTHVNMPGEVREIYNEVNSASVQAQTILENAYNYRDRLIPQARSTASTYTAQATADQSAAIAQANNALAEFWGVVEEYEQNPQVVKIRLLNTKVNEFVQKIGKIRVVQNGETKIILMP